MYSHAWLHKKWHESEVATQQIKGGDRRLRQHAENRKTPCSITAQWIGDLELFLYYSATSLADDTPAKIKERRMGRIGQKKGKSVGLKFYRTQHQALVPSLKFSC